MIHRLILSAITAFLLSAGVTLAQGLPIEFIKVAEVGQLIHQGGAKVAFVDVRSRQEYLIQHIKGAMSVPLSAIDMRSREIPREGLVVLY